MRPKIKIGLSVALIGLLLVAGAVSARAATVSVVRCPTVAGLPGRLRPTPAHLQVKSAARLLVAYTNSESYLLAPAGMRCSGIAAADGGSQVFVWPTSGMRPRMHSRGDGLTLTVDPACAGCKAADACPFFAGLARSLGFPCTTAVPAGERALRPRSRLVLFEDPPGQAGDGWPSGGRDAANGVAGYTSGPDGGHVYRATCTLPDRDSSVCTAGLDDAISRYG